jgi:hypothetical protein
MIEIKMKVSQAKTQEFYQNHNIIIKNQWI